MPKSRQELAKENILGLYRLYEAAKEIEAAATSLRAFVKVAWPYVDPAPFVQGWHVDAICEHLEAMTDGHIRKLIINISPRSSKSTLIAIMWPAWVWITKPEAKWIFSSYDLKLAQRHSRSCRQLIKSPWYQKSWSERFKINADSDTLGRFDNDKMGFRVATSSNAGIIGEGGDYICLPPDELVWTEHGKIQIKDLVDLKIDCRVWSLNHATGGAELQPITNWFENHGSPIVEIRLRDGSSIRCTPDHRIWTARGWVRADDIGYDDVLPRLSLPDASNGSPVDLELPGERSSRFVRCEYLDHLFQNETSMPVRGRSSLAVGLEPKALGCVRPSVAVPNGFNRADADLEDFSQAFGGFHAGSDGAGLLRSEHRSGPLLESTMAQSICDVLGSGAIRKIVGVVVGAHSIPVANLLPVWTRPDEMTCHELVDVMEFALSALAKVGAGVAFVNSEAEQPGLDSQGSASGTSDRSRFTAKTPSGRHAVESLESDDRKPSLIHFIGSVNNSYCVTVRNNHNFLAGNGVHPITIANCQDDPNDLREMNSEAYIESVIFNHDNVLSSRLNDRRTGRRLIVQQRSHENDLTGHVLSKEDDWEHLIIPMEYEGDERRTAIGFKDPRTKIGELMCASRFSPSDATEEKKKAMVWAGQYQQRPAPSEGAKFKRHWWNFYNPIGTDLVDANGKPKVIRLRVPGGDVIEKLPVTIPAVFEQTVHGWDMAFKEKESNDFVSGQVWGRVGSNSYLLARDTRHMDFPETLQAVRQMAAQFPCPEKMVEGKANGPAVIQTLRNEIPGLIESPIDGGLPALANSMTGYCEAGNWFLPNPDLFPWVYEFIEVFAAYPNAKHDDDVAACCHANRRLFDSISNSAAPEFRVSPRIGEPETACHVSRETANIPAHWRRWIAVAPGNPGAALWFAETPKRSLRVYRELSLEKLDANEAGRRIAEATLPDVRAYVASLHATAKWNIDILLEKAAFAPIDPIGCYAELLEHGVLNFDPTHGEWEDRQLAKQEMKLARFSAQMAEMRDSAWERLRDLLRFKPADYKELPYDRKKAVELSRLDIQEYKRYMAAVEGRIEGEYPKIKFSPQCKGVIQALGASRRAEDVGDCFLRALLIGISAPESMMTEKPSREVPWSGRSMALQSRRGRRVG